MSRQKPDYAAAWAKRRERYGAHGHSGETPADRALVARMWTAGRSAAEIAHATGSNANSIGSIVRALGLKRQDRKRRGGLSEQFEAFVLPEPNSGCWLWDGSTDRRGYGQLRIPGRRLLYAAHVSLTLAGKPRPDDAQCACHRCDTPSCVNPDHLFWGTQADNMRDMASKGRWRNQFRSGESTQ